MHFLPQKELKKILATELRSQSTVRLTVHFQWCKMDLVSYINFTQNSLMCEAQYDYSLQMEHLLLPI